MNQRQYLIKGTILLTMAGFATRTAGFFYKIFLSHTIGAKEIGLYQLTLPVYSICMSVACGGIQTAISRFTSEYQIRKDTASVRRIFGCALLLSVFLALCCTFFLLTFSKWVSTVYLMEPTCFPLLRIIAWSLPFAAVHCCITGYFIGLKNVTLSAFSQMAEQMSRIIVVLLFYTLFRRSGHPMDSRIMALGQLAGELTAAFYCMYHLYSVSKKESDQLPRSKKVLRLPFKPDRSSASSCTVTYPDAFHMILSVSLPLGTNRLLTCVFQSMEAALLPKKLQQFGLSSHSALASYGIMTGMVLPLILFPTAVTSAISTLLLPAVAEAQTLRESKKIQNTVQSGIRISFSMGFCFMILFLLFGTPLTLLLFDTLQASSYIKLLSVICPFLYLNTTMFSVIHGLGKSSHLFFWNMVCFGIRILSVIFLVPIWGMDGYLTGTICSHIFLSLCICFSLRGYLFAEKKNR